MLVQHRRRWTNIEAASLQCLVGQFRSLSVTSEHHGGGTKTIQSTRGGVMISPPGGGRANYWVINRVLIRGWGLLRHLGVRGHISTNRRREIEVK